MSRILEHQHADEQTVVSRVLVELHQAIDRNFPHTQSRNRQYAKTVFTGVGESTAIDQRPTADSGNFNNMPRPEPVQHEMVSESTKTWVRLEPVLITMLTFSLLLGMGLLAWLLLSNW
jgi:hypothetical protein